MRLRVMTYNIHHGVGMDRRLDLTRIARTISESGAELVALQEVDRHFGSRSEFADQAGWLAERLSMDVAYGSSLDLDPGQPERPRRQYGNALLCRYPIAEPATRLLPRCEASRNPEERSLLTGRITVAGTPIWVHNTHLHQSTRQGRLTQARTVRELIGSPSDPVILCGDFNAAPDTTEVREIGRGLVDAWTRAGNGPGYTFSAQLPRIRIDYVLTSPELTATGARVLDTRASDHRPVVVELVSCARDCLMKSDVQVVARKAEEEPVPVLY
ncbi:MAG: endonuclease/exonuclease/phosphatase family protein, partial [Micromonosporaceae bacterium]